MGDVADILGIGKQQVSAVEEASRIMGEKPKPAKGTKKSKPKGMSRELFSLLGPDSITPAIVNIPSDQNFFSRRRNVSIGNWVFAPFKNSARTDGQEFYHWVKSEMENLDYPYAKFNAKLDIISYTDTEYDTILHSAQWTRSETDHLMYICHKYDLRWPVIADRYEPVPSRPTEELQARYYEVVVKLRDAKSGLSEALKKVESHSVFDLAYEKSRRTQLDIMFRRTREEEAEELKLREELKFLDAQMKRLKKTAKVSSDKGGTAKAVATANMDKSNTTATAAVSGASYTSETGLPLTVAQPAPGRPCLQSTRLLTLEKNISLSKSLLKKMSSYVREVLSIQPESLLPTRAVCDMFDQVRLETVGLLSLQTALSKKEKDVKASRAANPKLVPKERVEILVPRYQEPLKISETELTALASMGAAGGVAPSLNAVVPVPPPGSGAAPTSATPSATSGTSLGAAPNQKNIATKKPTTGGNKRSRPGGSSGGAAGAQSQTQPSSSIPTPTAAGASESIPAPSPAALPVPLVDSRPASSKHAQKRQRKS